MNGLTALLGLELLDLAAGSTLLVTGGAGLLASYAIPLAKRAGFACSPTRARPTRSSCAASAPTSSCRAASELVAAAREAAPGGVDGVFDTALLGRDIFPAIRDGGGLAFVRTWTGEDVEDGVTIHPRLGRRRPRAHGLALELRQLAGAGASRCASPRRSRPSGRQTRTG